MSANTNGLVAKGSTLFDAQRQAYGAIEGTVLRETFLLTYMDAFRIVGVFFLFFIPLLLFKRRKGGEAAPVSLH